MGTPFEDIYKRAIFKFTDFNFLDFETELKAEIMRQHLLSAIVDFSRASAISLTHNETEFIYDLGVEEQEILALGLVYHWLSGKVLNSELLRNVMHNKDYKSYSPANLLKEMQSLRSSIKQEFVGRINTYSFRNSNLQNMRTFGG